MKKESRKYNLRSKLFKWITITRIILIHNT